MAVGSSLSSFEVLQSCVLGLLLFSILRFVVKSVLAAIRHGPTDIASVPAPPLSFWRRYSIGHNLLYHVLRADAFDTAALFNTWRREQGHVFQLFVLFGERCIMATSESAIRQVHISKQSSFGKAVSTRLAMASIVGENGILLAEGERHAQLRRAVSPAMHHDALIAVGETFLEQGGKLADRLERMGQTGGDVLREMRISAFDVIVETCLGRKSFSADVLARLQDAYLTIFPEPPLRLLIVTILYKFFWFVGDKHFSYREDLKRFIRSTINDACTRCVQKHKEGSTHEGTPLVALMVHEDTKKNISNTEMVETILSFLAAGQVTTSMSICWTLYILAREPQWQEKLLLELQGWSNEEGLDSLDRLPLLDRVVRESLRLYPPVFFTTRQTTKLVEIDGFKIPPNVVVRVPVLAIHRNEDIWGADAHEFNPDRFLQKGLFERTKMYWCPFSFGSRGCIGQRFALLEIKAFTAQILRKLKVTVKPFQDKAPSCVGPFATPDGLKLYFESR